MIQIILTILSSSVKFAMTFPIAILQFNFNMMETILWTNIGGILGIYFFAFLLDKVIVWWNRIFRKKIMEAKAGKKEKKIFSKKKPQNHQDQTTLRTDRDRTVHPISVIYTLFYTFWDRLLFKHV